VPGALVALAHSLWGGLACRGAGIGICLVGFGRFGGVVYGSSGWPGLWHLGKWWISGEYFGRRSQLWGEIFVRSSGFGEFPLVVIWVRWEFHVPGFHFVLKFSHLVYRER
jgi:hypothetical protein